MGKVTERKVGSLTGFTQLIEEVLAQSKKRNNAVPRVENWYRGHISPKYKLEPNLYRHPKIANMPGLLGLEGSMMRDFLRQGVLLHSPLLHNPILFSDDQKEQLKVLFYMQHYGIPTRLLDWTGNPFIALYFALTQQVGMKPKKPQDAVVWILDPWAWNRKALDELNWGDSGPAIPDEEKLKTYHPREVWTPAEAANMYAYPVALRGVSNTQRIFAQKGAFTIFGKSKLPMETIYDKEDFPKDCLVKVVIPGGSQDDLLEKLIAIGYTDSVAYPDLHGLALEIRRLNGFRM